MTTPTKSTDATEADAPYTPDTASSCQERGTNGDLNSTQNTIPTALIESSEDPPRAIFPLYRMVGRRRKGRRLLLWGGPALLCVLSIITLLLVLSSSGQDSSTEPAVSQHEKSGDATPTAVAAPTPAPSAGAPPTQQVTARATALPTFGGASTSTETEALCVDFSYQLRTAIALNLTADHVFQQTGNSLRVGLEEAGRAVTVAFVEDYYREPTARRRQRHRQRRTRQAVFQVTLHPVESSPHIPVQPQGGAKRLPLLIPRRQDRLLLLYSEELPSTVTAVVDMPFCDDDKRCLLLQHLVCVVWEAGVDGDDPTAVHGKLTQTLRGAIQSGRFFDEIPPEHLPP
jgi:hypothetical protein